MNYNKNNSIFVTRTSLKIYYNCKKNSSRIAKKGQLALKDKRVPFQYIICYKNKTKLDLNCNNTAKIV